MRQRPFVVGPFIVDPERDRVTSTATRERRSLEPDPMVTLVMLAANAGQTTTREEIAAVICPNAEPDENPVADAVDTLRVTFEDDADDPWMIEVDPVRDGYRLVAPVELIASDSGHWHIDDDTGELTLDPPPAAVAARDGFRWGRWLLILAILGFVAFLAVRQVRAHRAVDVDPTTPIAATPAVTARSLATA